MTIVLVPAARTDAHTAPTVLPDYVPPAWLDGPTVVVPRRTVPAVQPSEPATVPLKWLPAGKVSDLVRIELVPKAGDAGSPGNGMAFGVAAAVVLGLTACGFLWAAHTSESSPAPTPAPVVSPAPSRAPDCDLNPAACAIQIVPAAAEIPMTLAQALGMAVAVAP